MAIKCENCKIYNKALKENGCCIWYMDNVVINGKTVAECTDYKPIKK